MIAIIGDLHIGVKNASKHHHAYMEKVLDSFFLELEEKNIKTVIQLGDLFDDRKVLHLWAWDFFDRVIQPKIETLGLTWYNIVGNHDSHYKETLEINTPRLRLGDHKNVVIVDSPTEIDLKEDGKFLLLPWINKSNEQETLKIIEETDARFCCGHFEFSGFDLYRGQPAKSHFKHDIFSKFERVYSGHYHTFSSRDNVVYSGTPYELTWQDCEDSKYFLIHSIDGFEKIPTKEQMYIKVRYTDTLVCDSINISGKVVRVLVNGRPDKLKFNAFIHALEQMQPFDLKIQEAFQDELSEETTQEVDLTNTRDIIVEYIANSNIDLDADRLMSIFDELYSLAQTEED